MDEDVEIMSDDDGEAPHQKCKGKDKKQVNICFQYLVI